MAEKKPPTEQEAQSPEPAEAPPEEAAAKPGSEKGVILMPVSDVAEWDDDARMKPYGPNPKWPMSGMSEDEALAAAKELPDPKGE